MSTKTADRKVKYQPTMQILIEDLKKGDVIATRLLMDKHRQLVLDHETGAPLAEKTMKVEDLDVCEGKWRTHIHVNKRDCHDIRRMIDVVA
jgi:hypothetical protein